MQYGPRHVYFFCVFDQSEGLTELSHSKLQEVRVVVICVFDRCWEDAVDQTVFQTILPGAELKQMASHRLGEICAI